MHLRAVTLRGFKSFADRTVLEFDRGLVAIVGPNGAGKSNLIDAMVWCLGTLSARALRAEAMADVIFTGTEQRNRLGMGQVVLTLDNADGTFPLDFSEVQVGRTLYRDGASEYAINGTTCRLLDVQELLSEAGIGRELHAVVAQGQVDEIVGSKPTELRSFVEEAAGISKHRRRKERALRKIEQVGDDISRVADLAGELRRQLRPLRSQADQAQRHVEITERLREIRIGRLVGDLDDLERERERAMATREGASEELETQRTQLAELRERREAAETELEAARRRASDVRRGLEHLRSAQASALRAVIALRERAHAQPDIRRRDALAAKQQELDGQEAEVRSELDGLAGRLAEIDDRATALRDERDGLRTTLATASERLVGVREEITTNEAESRTAEQAEVRARAEAGAAAERATAARAQMARLGDQADAVRGEIETLDAEEGRAGLTVQRLEAERSEHAAAHDEADAKLRRLDSDAARVRGRLESLRTTDELLSSRRAGATRLRENHGAELDARGVLGELIRVAPGLEAAVDAVLGHALDALVVAGHKTAEAIRRAERDGVDAVIAPTLPAVDAAPALDAARPLAAAIEAPTWLRGTIQVLTHDTYLVADEAALAVYAQRYPDAVFVSPGGRMLASRGISRPARRGGSDGHNLAGAIDQAERALQRIEAEQRRWTVTRDQHAAARDGSATELDAARSTLGELEGRIAAAADRLRDLDAQAHAASLEHDLADRDRTDRLTVAEASATTKRASEDRLTALRAQEEELGATVLGAETELAALEERLAADDAAKTDALTARASLDERLRGIAGTRAELQRERADAEAGPTDPADLAAAEAMMGELDGYVASAETRVRDLLAGEETLDDRLRGIVSSASRAEVQVASLEPRSLHAAEEVSRLDARIEEIGTRLAQDFDIPPTRARIEFGPPPDPDAASTEERRLDRELKRMGPVNPLAAQEITDLERRRSFLEAQLEDLRSSKRDLGKLVRSADEQMREMLVRAAEDANEKFQELIGLLFPEGGGRMRLTGHEDPLEAGIEIEVRLGRKGHRKLGFLSGGEKALAGLGFLFALHLARPTPFIVLDEVDAPLDDANLGRFLRLLDSLRTQTQVIVITHQKRTMEQADTLVGVTLNPDGTSRVIKQSLREHIERFATSGT